MHYAYSDLATACMHAHMADICAICNSDVIHGTRKAKKLRLFRECFGHETYIYMS